LRLSSDLSFWYAKFQKSGSEAGLGIPWLRAAELGGVGETCADRLVVSLLPEGGRQKSLRILRIAFTIFSPYFQELVSVPSGDLIEGKRVCPTPHTGTYYTACSVLCRILKRRRLASNAAELVP